MSQSRRATATAAARPEAVLEVLTSPSACRAWCPFPFAVGENSPERLTPGATVTVRGALAGRSLSFEVKALEVTSKRFALRATGAFDIEATYELIPEGGTRTHVRAEIRTGRPRGLSGRLMVAAADALLTAGALDVALRRITGMFA